MFQARPGERGRRRRRSGRAPLSLLLAAAAAAVVLIARDDRARAAAAAADAPSPSPPTPSTPGADERFTEELLLRPLPSGHLLALFHFESSTPAGRAHHVRFPRAAAQLLAAAPAARRVELSLAAGRWRPGEWGAAPFEAKPGGAELRAAFDVAAALEEEDEAAEREEGEEGEEGEEVGEQPPARRRRRRRWPREGGERDEAPALRRAWGSLAHGLSGLLCASLNFVARPEATAREVDLLRRLRPPPPSNATGGQEEQEDDEDEDGDEEDGGDSASSWAWLRASLPREAVCTENLTPWLKLLPCRDGAGLAALLRARPAVFAAEYHALSVSLRASDEARSGGGRSGGGGGGDASGGDGRVVLTQRLALVLRPLSAPLGGAPAARPPPPPGRWAGWSLAATLAAEGALAGGACPQASLSRVYVQAPPELLDSAGGAASAGDGGGAGKAEVVLTPPPHGELPAFRASAAAVGLLADSDGGEGAAAPPPSRVFWFDVDALAAGADVSLAWAPSPSPVAPAALQPRWAARAYTAGANMARGTLVLELERAAAATGGGKRGAPSSSSSSSSSALSSAREDDADNVVCVSLVVPWFVRLWVHTLDLTLDGARAGLDARTVARRAAPASARRAPLALDLCLDVPGGVRVARLSGAFSTGFMTVFEFPPDAHRGVDVPSARVTWLEKEGGQASAAASSSSSSSSSSPSSSPLLAELARPRECAAYSDGVLVALAPPDFSMPYNVVCLTSTALAVFVGASVNAMLRRPAKKQGGRSGGGRRGRRGGETGGTLLGAADGGGGQGTGTREDDADADDGDDDDEGESSTEEGEGEAAAAARAARRRQRRRRRAARTAAFLLLFAGLALWIDPELRASASVFLPEEWRPKNSTEEARAAFAGVS